MELQIEAISKHLIVGLGDFWRDYFPICLYALRKSKETRSDMLLLQTFGVYFDSHRRTNRVIIGVGGAAASSKTTFAQIITKSINVLSDQDVFGAFALKGEMLFIDFIGVSISPWMAITIQMQTLPRWDSPI